MKKLSLLAAVALFACGTVAQAQPAPNPFARPSASAAPSPGGTPSPSMSPGMTGSRPTSGANTPHVPGQNGPMPGAPGMAPAGSTPYPPSPGVYPQGLNMPGANGMPGSQGMPGAPANGVETTEEEVSASRIGKVNGMHIYRGQNTYMFESAKKRKVVRKLVPSAAGPGLPPATTAASAQEKNPNLPSMVGRPAPKN